VLFPKIPAWPLDPVAAYTASPSLLNPRRAFPRSLNPLTPASGPLPCTPAPAVPLLAPNTPAAFTDTVSPNTPAPPAPPPAVGSVEVLLPNSPTWALDPDSV
jgi:hypothetical protein